MAKVGRNAKTEKVAEYVEWNNFEIMRLIGADAKIARYRELTIQGDAIEAEKGELKSELEPALIAAGQKAVRHGELLLIRCNGGTPSKISYQQLILKGVDPLVIAECTIPGTKYTYIQVKASIDKPQLFVNDEE